MKQSGIKLLGQTANEAEDPQTLRMVAGAIANLCGNGTFFLLLMDGTVGLLKYTHYVLRSTQN